jgi:hypothetical protein
LSHAQRAAFVHIAELTQRRQDETRLRIATILRACGSTEEQLHEAMRSVRSNARIALHFHPDRFGSRPMTVAECLLADGQYRNQFETGLSNGSRTAYPEGSRDRWERQLFGEAYHRPGVAPRERPKYGALELIRYRDGPIPRFGSCYFVLAPSVIQRTTFTFSGSEQPGAVNRAGSMANFEPVLEALLTEVANGATATVPWPPFHPPTLGVRNLTVPTLLELLSRDLASRAQPYPVGPTGRVLDSCIEAHVHGPIDLRRDVDALVIDPAFQETRTGATLVKLCREYEIPNGWHSGFELPVEEVVADFRGPAMPQLANRIARGGIIDAAVIGAAASTLHSRPETWADWGSTDDAMQHLKQLWHVLVHYGRPRS